MTLILIVLCSVVMARIFCNFFTRAALFCPRNACLYDGVMIAPDLMEFRQSFLGLCELEVDVMSI